jgi:hypothetical protein
MAQFEVTSPDGAVHLITAPDSATPEQIQAYVNSSLGKPAGVTVGTSKGPDGQSIPSIGFDGAGPAPGMLAQGQQVTAPDVAQQPAQPPQRSTFYQAGTRQSPMIRGIANALEGPLFNWAGEAVGGIGAATDKLMGRNSGVPMRDLYEGYRDAFQGASDKYGKDHPVAAPVTQAIATLPTALLGGTAAGGLMAPAKSLGQGLMRMARFGAVSGAVNGAGSAETPEQMQAAADQGALLGGIMGPVMGTAGNVGTKTAANVWARFGVGNKTAERIAGERVAEQLLRDMANEQQHGASAIGMASARLDKLGPQARVADLGQGASTNMRGQLDFLASQPGMAGNQVANAIRERQVTRGGRLVDAAEDALGTQGARLSSTVEDLIAERARNAGPLYERLRKIDVPIDQELASVVDSASRIGLHKTGRNIAAGNSVSYTLDDPLAAQTGKYSVGDLDTLKQAIDTKIMTSGTDRATGRLTPEGASLNNLRVKLIDHLDNLTGGFYKEARDAFAGPSALIAAAELGKRSLNQDVMRLSGAVERMSAGERDAFRVGAFEALRTKVGSQGGQTELLNLYKTPNMQEKLRLLFPDIRSYREFASAVAGEERLKKFEKVGTGSQTAARLNRADDENAAILAGAEAAAATKTMSPSVAISAIKNVHGRVVMPEPVRNEMARLLLAQGPQAQAKLGDLSRYVTEAAARRKAAETAYGVTGGTALSNALQAFTQ